MSCLLKGVLKAHLNYTISRIRLSSCCICLSLHECKDDSQQSPSSHKHELCLVQTITYARMSILYDKWQDLDGPIDETIVYPILILVNYRYEMSKHRLK